ncbi:MAG: hypothetical protein ACXW6K_15165 [Candidatus Binatia bacterium]
MNLQDQDFELIQAIKTILNKGISITLHPPTKAIPESISPEQIFTTLGGKEKRFYWEIKDGILEIERIDANIKDHLELTLLLDVLHELHEKFKDDEFPLANNVQKLKEGSEIEGIGSLIYKKTQNVALAQSASQLAAILTHCEIFKWNGKRKNIGLSFVNCPKTLEELLSRLLSIKNRQ